MLQTNYSINILQPIDVAYFKSTSEKTLCLPSSLPLWSQIPNLLPLAPASTPSHSNTRHRHTSHRIFAKAAGAAVSMVSPSQGLCLRDMIVLNEWLCLMALLQMEGENTCPCCSHSIILPLQFQALQIKFKLFMLNWLSIAASLQTMICDICRKCCV